MVDVLLLNYNDSETTITSIKYLNLYKCIDKITVVDNFSTDDSYYKLRNYSSEKIIVLRAKKNGGYGTGNNIGIEYLTHYGNSNFILLCNPDTFIKEKTIVQLEKFLNEFPSYGIVAPFMYNSDGKKQKNTAFQIPTKWKYIMSLDLFITKYTKSFYYSKISDCEKNFLNVGSVAGSLFLFNKKKMVSVGMFDENIFLYCEEMTLGIKFRKLNYKIALLCRESFIHNHSVTIDKVYNGFYSKRKLLNKSKLYVIKNYYNTNKFEYLIAKIISNISLIEAYVLTLIKKQRRSR